MRSGEEVFVARGTEVRCDPRTFAGQFVVS